MKQMLNSITYHLWSASFGRKVISSTLIGVIAFGGIIYGGPLNLDWWSFFTGKAEAAVANSGTIVYANYSGTVDNLNARTYTDPTTAGSQYTTVDTADTNGIVWSKIVASPTREEKIAAQLNATGILKILKCTTGCDATGDWSEIGSMTSVTSDAGAETYRAFDIAYEQLSGLFTIVFAQASNAGDVYYCQYNGTSWSPATVCGSTFAPGSGNEIDMDGVGVAGQPEWIRLVARGDRLTSTRTNELMLAASDANDDLFLASWDGTAWSDQTNPVDDLFTSDVQKFDIAWEETTGEALAVVTDDAVVNLRYVTFTSGAWGSIQTSGEANNGGHVFNRWIQLASDPSSDDIAIIIQDSGDDTEFFHWDGSTLSDLDATDDLTTELADGQHAQVAWTRFTSEAVFMYTDANTLTSDMQCWQTGGGNFTGVIGDVGNANISNADDVDDATLVASPNNDRMIMTRRGAELVSGTGDNLVGLTYDGAGCGDTDWTTLGVLLAGGASAGVEGGTLGNTARKTHSSAYTPYSPWSLNWRFFDDETVDNPSTGLNGAAENTTPTGVDPEEFIRLRINVAERGGMGQTDTRKILQYTSGCTPNASGGESGCTWTDVGDTSETSAVWRYATAGETCTGCADGSTSTTSRLTGTNQGSPSVYYVSDKDAAQDADFDHTALLIREIDFPLKAEDIDGNTTYYFRVYEPRISSAGQSSPIYREQDNDGNNDCATATCTYPSLTTSPPTYEQSAYRFYSRHGSDPVDVGAPLAALNTVATTPTQGTGFKMRAFIHVGSLNLPSSGESFKLQYAQRSGSCDNGFSGESYADVTSGTPIAFYDQGGASDGDSLQFNAEDPEHGVDSANFFTYEELNPFTNLGAPILAGVDGMWDFSLVDYSAIASTYYCLRIVTNAGTNLNTYTVVPEILTNAGGPTNDQLLKGGKWWNNGVKMPYTF